MSPRPRPVARLSEKTDTVVSFASSVSTTNVPNTASRATPSGSTAATRPPNTSTSARNVNGPVRRSDFARSFWAWTASSRVTSTLPVTPVVITGPLVSYSGASTAATLILASSLPRNDATISAWRWSRLRSCDTSPRLQYDEDVTTPVACPNRRVRPSPAARTFGLLTVPSFAVTTMTKSD